MAELWPVTFPDAKRVSIWESQYRAILGHLEGDELNAAYYACMDGWKKKAAPLPADILRAHTAKTAPDNDRHDRQMNAAEFQAYLAKRDADIREARRTIAEQYRQQHAEGFERADREGWIGLLERQVQIAANILAQRSQVRKPGKEPKELTEFEREDYCIAANDEGEFIEITQANIALWRGWLSTPPKPISNNIPKMHFAGT